MPVQKGFKGNAPFPESLMSCFGLGNLAAHGIEVVPLALASKRQTNPIYSMPPGGHGSVRLVENITTNVIANQVGVAEAFGQIFVYARTELPHYTEPAYINIWSRKLSSWAPHGVLYCTVSVKWMLSDDPFGGECLCGKSCNRWAARGWVCPYVQVADW